MQNDLTREARAPAPPARCPPRRVSSRAAPRRHRVAAWAVVAVACFAVAVGGVTGESLFERLHSGAPTVEPESSRAQDVIAAEPARASRR